MRTRASPAGMKLIATLALVLTLLPATASGQGGPRLQFRTERIFDPQQGGIILGTLSVPVQWRVSSQVQWRYNDVSNPVRAFFRVDAPDGMAWIEFFPIETFFWLDPYRSPAPIGGRSLGLIHAPNIGIRDALMHYVVGPYRGRNQNLQVLSINPIDPGRLAAAFGDPPSPGEAAVAHLRYQRGGQTVDEDIYAFLGAPNRIPYTGRQGTTYETHRLLGYVHAVGAASGQLQSVYPLLGYIVMSARVDPSWLAHRKRVQDELNRLFNAAMQQGYAVIDAAGAASRAISANNDSLLGSLQAQRRAQTEREAAARLAASRTPDASDDFSGYLRGTQRMKDPYWGESERSYADRYHWTDGSGNYRSSNDPGFNPNIGTGGGVTWQRMDPAR